MNYIPRNEVKWSTVRYLKLPLETTDELAQWQYHFLLPAPLSEWDVFSYWEVERTLHMRDNLKKGDVLYDIGTEQGWLNLAYAEMVGPENIVLIEPTPEFWPNIQATWEKNFGRVDPRGFYAGLIGAETDDERIDFKHWPSESAGALIDRNKYQYLHDNTESVPVITFDDMVARSKIIPTAVTMDVEGAEMEILKGMGWTLSAIQPKLWISVHPELGERDYGYKTNELHELLESYGYVGTLIATDHEEHWYFEVKKNDSL